MKREDALALAKPESGLDIIEVVPHANPPVVRVMSFDKYRYEQGKAERKERRAQKSAESKQIQISARAAQNDLLIKVRQLEEFLESGHPVEIQMKLRGREKGNKAWAEQKLRDFLHLITVEYKMIAEPKFGGRGMLAQITKK
jgi:translation initiation factor IF-3